MADPEQTGAGQSMSRTEEQHALECWRLEVAVARARHERDVAQWRNRCLRNRRAWRMFEALVAVGRSPRRWLTLPLTLLRIMTDRREAPEPPPLELPASPVPVRPSPLRAVRRARSALEQGQHARALVAAEEALAIDPRDVRALAVAWRAHEVLGDVTEALEVVRRQRAVQDRSWLETAERRLQGSLIALDPQWMPLLAPFEGTTDGPVLMIDVDRVPEPVPGTAQLVTIPAQRDLGEHPSLDELPMDSATQDLAWWAARSAREHRPRAVAARLTWDLRPAIAALAAARAGQVSFCLVETSEERAAGATDSEWGRLLRARAAQLRADADVLVADAAALTATGQQEAR